MNPEADNQFILEPEPAVETNPPRVMFPVMPQLIVLGLILLTIFSAFLIPKTFDLFRVATEDSNPTNNITEVQTTVDPFIPLATVPIKAEAAFVWDIKAGRPLYEKNAEEALPLASITKLMTALVAAENINLDKSVLISEQTLVHSLIPRLGERSKVSLYSLLQLLLVESSNEAAEVISAELGPDEFIKLMNNKAESLGMKDTKFADASGLSSDNVSSLQDLLLLAKYIYEKRSFIFEVTANQNLPTAYVSGEFGELVNFNKVDELDNLIGGKVGETIAAGQTSVTLHHLKVKDQNRVIAIIILGSTSRNSDVNKLYDYAEEKFAR